MKTPSSLALLLYFAALPAAAQLKAGERCDVNWLQDSQKILSQSGQTVSDDRLETVGNAIRLKFDDRKGDYLKTCDAATWRHLAVVSVVDDVRDATGRTKPATYLAWRNKAAENFWKEASVSQQLGLMLVVNDFYAAVDAKGAAVNAAADAVLDAAKALGIADHAASDKSLAELAAGSSGGKVGLIKPRVVKIEPFVGTGAPETLGANMRKLVVDGGGLGEAVVAYRVAVLALHAELGRQGASIEAIKRRIPNSTAGGLNDFTSGLPLAYAAVAADQATAKDEGKFKKALAALVGPEPRTEFKDQGLSKAALLDPVDQGLRNLVAIRAAEIDKIHAAAAAKLGKKTIAEFEAGARASTVVSGLPKGSLSAATFKAMSETPEYMRLDMLYENNKAKPEWLASPEGKRVAAAREEMKEAALSAKIEVDPATKKKQVVYTHNGTKTVLDGLVPSSIEASDEVRAGAAAIISRSILEGSLEDAKNQAILAAIRGEGQAGQNLVAVKPGEIIAPKDIPPAAKKIKDGAAGCDNPKDLVRNDYETYAARQNAAAAEMASGNVRSRNDVEKKRLEQLTAADLVCKQEKAAAAGIKQDYFDDAAVAKGERERAGAAADAKCAAAKQAIEEAAKAKIEALAAAEKGDRDPAKILSASATDLEAGFAVAIDGSVDALKADYLKAGSMRQRKLAEITGNSPRVAEYTGMYFAEAWPKDASMKDKKQAAISACAKALGFGNAKASYWSPDNPEYVDKHCKVNEGLLAYIASKKGTNRPAQSAEEAKKPAAPLEIMQ